MALIDRCHLEPSYYGSRRFRDRLENEGHRVNRKRVQRLMRTMGLAALYPKRNWSLAIQAHRGYPYLLRPPESGVGDRRDVYPDGQRFSVSGSHGRIFKAGAFLASVKHAGYEFFIEALNEAIKTYGAREVFNTDQGSELTSENFTLVLKQRDIRISTDGEGRWVDNVFVERPGAA